MLRITPCLVYCCHRYISPKSQELANTKDMKGQTMQDIETRTRLISPFAPAQFYPVGMKYVRFKRFLDVFLACILLVIFSIITIPIIISIKLTSAGPILYRQKRIGSNGKPFMMLKFRTMTAGNDNKSHLEHVQRLIRENLSPEDLGVDSLKLQDDHRITGIGKILRTFSLDELPQLLNVLHGEMSLVGPRPPLPYEYELYNDTHKLRMQALPGITGLWQVAAHNLVSFEEMVQIDLCYIETMNLWLDLKIMLATPWEMVRGKGGK